jgi:transposase-like protein
MFWAWRWGPSEAEPFWTKFLRSLTARGLRGVKLVISDSHEGLKKAVSKVFSATNPAALVASIHLYTHGVLSVHART